MAAVDFTFFGARLRALGSGALFWPAAGALCVADLHLGKAQRPALAGGAPLPPYEVRETLGRLQNDLQETGARQVIVLGDGFDDPSAAARLAAPDRDLLAAITSGRHWIWIAGNHDAAPGTRTPDALPSLALQGLVLRHIADPTARAEISGHYHPKMRLPGGRGGRAAFLIDAARIILPAYGAYTGGLWADSDPLRSLMGPDARAILTAPADSSGHSATETGDAVQTKASLVTLPLRLAPRARGTPKRPLRGQ